MLSMSFSSVAATITSLDHGHVDASAQM